MGKSFGGSGHAGYFESWKVGYIEVISVILLFFSWQLKLWREGYFSNFSKTEGIFVSLDITWGYFCNYPYINTFLEFRLLIRSTRCIIYMQADKLIKIKEYVVNYVLNFMDTLINKYKWLYTSWSSFSKLFVIYLERNYPKWRTNRKLDQACTTIFLFATSFSPSGSIYN